MTHTSALIDLHDVSRLYQMGETSLRALDGVSLSIAEGEYVAVVGTSGSGKSTLMNIVGLLDRPTGGAYHIHGKESASLSDSQLADLRNREIGFVFQQFNLLARAPAWRQVELPLFYANVGRSQSRDRAMSALEQVGLADRSHHKPEELSGGQQQRVAVARALVNRPSLLLADEPTGALDSRTSEEVLALFERLHQDGLTLVLVTHDREIAERARRVITMRDGAIISDVRTGGEDAGGLYGPPQTSVNKQTNGQGRPLPALRPPADNIADVEEGVHEAA